VTDWLSIIERAAYTRFSKTGSLEPFHLHRAELRTLIRQVSGIDLDVPALGVLCQVRVPVPSVGRDAWVAVDEWKT
jgi:hypothetical protein